MKKQVAVWLFFLALLSAAVLAAAPADLAGKWRAEFTTPDGTQRVNTFTFVVEGDKLTGTVAGGQDEAPLKDIKVSGDSITFSAERQWGLFIYKGKISGDEIKFTVQREDATFEMTARRMK
jgi:hypothetical protein